MKLFRILFILIILLTITSCKTEKSSEKILDDFLKITKENSEYILYDNSVRASGILRGKDILLDIDYNIYYSNGLPTGKILYFLGEKKFIEIDMDINYTNNMVSGSIKVYKENGVETEIEYLNIISRIENFIDLETAQPILMWYLANPKNIFERVDFFSDGKKISSIKNGEYYYDEEKGNIFELP